MGIAKSNLNIMDEFKKYGINAQISGNKIIIVYPKSAIEQKIKEEINLRIPIEYKNKITVKSLGDVIVEVFV